MTSAIPMSGATGRGPGQPKVRARAVVVASADAVERQRVSESLRGMRWDVFEAGGGAEAMALAEEHRPEALLVDSWLPDLNSEELREEMAVLYPGTDVIGFEGIASSGAGAGRSSRRNELLHALRTAREGSTEGQRVEESLAPRMAAIEETRNQSEASTFPSRVERAVPVELLPGMMGGSVPMRELARMVRLVSPRSATVLIEGETGTGKELVAKAVHQLSERAQKSFTVLNCAAIPESLLEAELFGHTRGAFTGAVTARTGRIEAAHGGTLFLDEIGEMPLALQAKMLRFLEGGELQRVGENETLRVDVRVIAATHQQLEKRAGEGTFRLDLYHRLAVFPVEVPALRDRMEDVPELVEYLLAELGRAMPRKAISAAALEKLTEYSWPGNVRELKHVLERAAILAEDRAEIGAEEIRFRGRG